MPSLRSLRLAAASLAAASLPRRAASWAFLSAPARDLQPLFDVRADAGPAGWLGADVATSVALGADPAQPGAARFLWLHGDTLVGAMRGGVRAPTGMPRNSLATLSVDGRGAPAPAAAPAAHWLRSHAGGDGQHWGWYSPPNASQWYWPTVALALPAQAPGAVVILAMRMQAAGGGGGLFPFAMAGMDVLVQGGVAGADLDAWPAPQLVGTTQRMQRDNWTLGCAAAYDAAAAAVLLLGAAGPRQAAVLARLPAADLVRGDFSALEYWMAAGAWAAAPADGSPPTAAAELFDFMPSETTLVWHEAMQLWYVVIANTFIYGGQIMLRTAPAVTGPWSQEIPVYDVPAEQLAGGVFCYAGKAHPEFSPPGSLELVFSYMCNTDGIPPLLNRTDIYVPQLVRVAILGEERG